MSTDMSKYEVVFVRHGQSVFNRIRALCGWYDTGLSGIGRSQARTAGKVLKQRGYVFNLAFTSVLVRARDTLSEMLSQMDCPDIEIRHAWQLNECHLGAWTGMTTEDFIKQEGVDTYRSLGEGIDLETKPMSSHHPYYREIVSNPLYKGQLREEDMPRHETFSMIMKRSVPYWNEVIVPEIKNGRRVVIVSHKLTLKGLIKHLEHLTAEQVAPIVIKNASPFVYELDEDMKPLKPFEFLQKE